MLRTINNTTNLVLKKQGLKGGTLVRYSNINPIHLSGNFFLLGPCQSGARGVVYA